jgi:hypothetical protein
VSLSPEIFLDGKAVLWAGDARHCIAHVSCNLIDAVVTDPPYALTQNKRGGSGVASVNLDNPYGRSRIGTGNGSGGFMGQKWDTGETAFDPEFWRQVLRVLKPGGHLVAFSGDRTYHRLAASIEDAGFEIRATLAWLHGQGFPKNLNVSAKLRGSLPADALCACAPGYPQTVQDSQFDCPSYRGSDDGRPLAGEDGALDGSPSLDDVRAHIRGGRLVDVLATGQANSGIDGGIDRPSILDSPHPSPRPSEDCQPSGSIPFDRRESTSPDEWTAAHRTAHGKSNNGHSDGGSVSSWRNANLPQCSICGKHQIQEGLGSALKPAMELICLARKPLSESTIAANVLRWGTGALNVDGCRIPSGSVVSTTPAQSAATLLTAAARRWTAPHRTTPARGDGPPTFSMMVPMR